MKDLHLSTEQLEERLESVLTSPRDEGEVVTIVLRPGVDERACPGSARFSPEGGIEGDRWAITPGPLPGGKPNPDAQVSLMNSRVLRLLAGSEERIALAGDNLVVDLDLSAENLLAGQLLEVGEVRLRITAEPHTGCDKFAERFGLDAVRWVNASRHKALHLRGRYARIVQGGVVRRGDVVLKVVEATTA